MSLTGSASVTNELQGSVESGGEVRGKLSGLEMLRGYSAYEVAVINGFSGTAAEWLASLKGGKGDPGYTPVKGKDYFIEADKKELVEALLNAMQGTVATAKIGEVTLLASEWTGSGSLYSQEVTIDGATENSQVDLTPSVEQLSVFYEKDLTFVTENEDGVVTVYAIGQKPTNDYTIQVTITEVNV